MKKLTKPQRMKFYKLMLGALTDKKSLFRYWYKWYSLCTLVTHIRDTVERYKPEVLGYKLRIEDFPELMAFKPETKVHYNTYWFEIETEEGFKQRVKLLKKIIA